MSDDVMIIAAIDFGTMYSGYSYSFKKHENDIIVNKNWSDSNSGIGTTVTKAPTCVLIDEDDKFIAFGFDSIEKFQYPDGEEQDQDETTPTVKKKQDPETTKKLYFYKEFKMELYKDQDLGKPGYKKMLKSSDEKHEIDAQTIFAMVLEYLQNKLLNDINDKLENKLEVKNLQWVLTVPAIWTDSAKRFMRECAAEAGLIEDPDSERILIALEPECASVFCKDLTTDPKNPDSAKYIKEGAEYMVVDCGGGTVDITAHKSEQDGLCEIFAISGNDWGGRNIDKRFEEQLELILGQEIYEKFRLGEPKDFQNLKSKFEESKGSIKFNDNTFTLNLAIPYVLNTLCVQVENRGLDKIIKDKKMYDVKFANGFLQFQQSAIDRMFKPQVEKICDYIVHLLKKEEATGIRFLFLVGGFSDCGCLQMTMKEKLDVAELKLVRIVNPDEAVLTIMRGAVKFGYNPQSITSRLSRATYGTRIYEPFNPMKHDSTKRVIGKDGKLYCKDIFHTILKKNETILHDDVKDFVFQPLSKGQKRIKFQFFSTKKKKVPTATLR